MNVDNTEYPPILSICSGSLGLERGINRVKNFRTVAYVEIEAFAIYNLVKKMEEGSLDPAPIWTNLKTFDIQPFRNKICGIVGGYPCQGESVAGRRKLEKDPRWLWPVIREIFQTNLPLFGFFENSAGHLSGSFRYVLADLQSMGYHVEAGIFSAAECGASQIRERLFILAVADRNRFRDMLADANSLRSGEGYSRFESNESDKTCIKRVAPPGFDQYEWESPRTLSKSGMGCTIDGYNARRDLIRLLGNSVVSDVAELAFRTLIDKIL